MLRVMGTGMDPGTVGPIRTGSGIFQHPEHL